MADSTRLLGISKSDAESQYLAYHEGRNGFADGSYKAKGWLVSIAAQVGARAVRYREQLARCSR